ncbi:MAG: carbamoylphosphate synthase large subunit, partial [Clostridia bacterium]|nr:carbamoylphosphate synthase large subunit [Clostridia bacterium]
MNYIFISPNFPHTYWQFCDRLRQNGVNVLGIGDSPYDGLESPLRSALTEYYKVDSLGDYDQVYRAVAYFAFRYGKIDWIESMNEYCLEQDARLRTDFNVKTGIQSDRIGFIKEKSLMKGLYLKAGIPTARQHIVSTKEAGRAFIGETGYPVIVKPDIGVGATNTWKLENDTDFNAFYDSLPGVPYVMEEFIQGDICSYDAILDSRCEPLFESMTVWPPVMDIVNKDLDLMYYTCPDVPEKLRVLGRKTVKAFGVDRRFVHLEFFRLTA